VEAELKSRILYFYGVTQSPAPAKMEELGVGEARIEAREFEGIICWVSWVPAGEFEKDLARNMENLDWLARASVAHQRAIAAIACQAEILPARFATVFHSEESLRRHVGGRLRQLERDFERVKGADEWGVKVFTATPAVAPQRARSGKEYLVAKAALLSRRDSSTESQAELTKFAQALERVAVESAAGGTITGGQRGLRFQRSLLVKKSNRKQLESVLARFSRRWAEVREIECTGPWPPYSFVSEETGGAK
jgi:Gas vesicle synthesis protein GvpL/GvpF